MTTDAQLIKRFIEEDDQMAFSELFERYRTPMKFYIMRYTKDEASAEDILQDSYIKIYEKLNSVYEEQGEFSGWAYTIARNTAIDYLRTRKRFVDVESGIIEDDRSTLTYFDLLPSNQISADEKMELKEEVKEVMDAIKELPENQRDIVMMRIHYGLKFKDIAEELDVKLNTVLGRMRYARINIPKIIDGTYEPASHYGSRNKKEDEDTDI